MKLGRVDTGGTPGSSQGARGVTASQPEWQKLWGDVQPPVRQECSPSASETAPSRSKLPPRGPSSHHRTSLWTKPQVSQSPGQGLLLQCNQEILFRQDIFSRKRAGSKCHVSRLLFHGNFGLFKEMVITLLPP